MVENDRFANVKFHKEPVFKNVFREFQSKREQSKYFQYDGGGSRMGTGRSNVLASYSGIYGGGTFARRRAAARIQRTFHQWFTDTRPSLDHACFVRLQEIDFTIALNLPPKRRRERGKPRRIFGGFILKQIRPSQASPYLKDKQQNNKEGCSPTSSHDSRKSILNLAFDIYQKELVTEQKLRKEKKKKVNLLDDVKELDRLSTVKFLDPESDFMSKRHKVHFNFEKRQSLYENLVNYGALEPDSKSNTENRGGKQDKPKATRKSKVNQKEPFSLMCPKSALKIRNNNKNACTNSNKTPSQTSPNPHHRFVPCSASDNSITSDDFHPAIDSLSLPASSPNVILPKAIDPMYVNNDRVLNKEIPGSTCTRPSRSTIGKRFLDDVDSPIKSEINRTYSSPLWERRSDRGDNSSKTIEAEAGSIRNRRYHTIVNSKNFSPTQDTFTINKLKDRSYIHDKSSLYHLRSFHSLIQRENTRNSMKDHITPSTDSTDSFDNRARTDCPEIEGTSSRSSLHSRHVFKRQERNKITPEDKAGAAVVSTWSRQEHDRNSSSSARDREDGSSNSDVDRKDGQSSSSGQSDKRKFKPPLKNWRTHIDKSIGSSHARTNSRGKKIASVGSDPSFDSNTRRIGPNGKISSSSKIVLNETKLKRARSMDTLHFHSQKSNNDITTKYANPDVVFHSATESMSTYVTARSGSSRDAGRAVSEHSFFTARSSTGTGKSTPSFHSARDIENAIFDRLKGTRHDKNSNYNTDTDDEGERQPEFIDVSKLPAEETSNGGVTRELKAILADAHGRPGHSRENDDSELWWRLRAQMELLNDEIALLTDENVELHQSLMTTRTQLTKHYQQHDEMMERARQKKLSTAPPQDTNRINPFEIGVYFVALLLGIITSKMILL